MSEFASKLAEIAARKEAIALEEKQLTDKATAEAGELVKQAGGLFLPREVILGAILNAVHGGEQAQAKFREVAERHFPSAKRRGRKPNSSTPASADASAVPAQPANEDGAGPISAAV